MTYSSNVTKKGILSPRVRGLMKKNEDLERETIYIISSVEIMYVTIIHVLRGVRMQFWIGEYWLFVIKTNNQYEFVEFECGFGYVFWMSVGLGF